MSDRLHYLFMFVSLTVLLVVQHCPIVRPVIRQNSQLDGAFRQLFRHTLALNAGNYAVMY